MGRKRRYYKSGDARPKIDTMNTLINKLEEVVLINTEVENKLELELELKLKLEENNTKNKLEVSNLIIDIREQLKIISVEKKGIARRLFRAAVGGRRRLVYDRDSTSTELRNRKKARFLNKSAKIALGYYRKTNLLPNECSVVDVIRATEYPCMGGYLLSLTFTTATHNSEEQLKCFETVINYGIDRTEVISVQIVPLPVTDDFSPEPSSSSEQEDC
ncbi:hypothetical protein ACP275_06G161500 [Erythranthe tilingii]